MSNSNPKNNFGDKKKDFIKVTDAAETPPNDDEKRQIEISKKGAIASNKVQKKNRDFLQKIEILAQMDCNEKEIEIVEKYYPNFSAIPDNDDYVAMALYNQAKKGNVKAIELIMRLKGIVIDKIAQTDSKGNDVPPAFIIEYGGRKDKD